MPSQAEITAATEITGTGKVLLASYLRASAFYLTFSWAFTDLETHIDETATNTTKSKMLAVILSQIEALGDGTVGARGGEFGADYSQSRDREQLCLLALSVIFDFAALGIVIANGQPAISGQQFALGTGLRGGVMPHVGAASEPFRP